MRLYHRRSGKRLTPATAKESYELAKPTERDRKQFSPEEATAGWQQPHKVASSNTCTPLTPTHTASAFATLEVEEATPTQSERRLEQLARPVERSSRTPRRKSRLAKKEALTQASTGKLSARQEPTQTTELSERQELDQTKTLPARRELNHPKDLFARRESPTCAKQNLARPHRSSNFLPGKAVGQAMVYLVDTGCNTNLVSKRVFDHLPKHIQEQRMECDTHGQMTGGTRLPFYRVVQIPIRVRDVKLEEIFVVSQINEDVILGMPFLARHDCKMDFARPVVTIGECELVCTDRFGRLMASRVQTIRRTTILPRTKIALSCLLTSHNHASEG